MTITRDRSRGVPSGRPVAAVSIALVSGLALVACGSSGTDGPIDPVPTSTSASSTQSQFCAEFRTDFTKLKNAGADVPAATQALDELAASAPAAIKSDVEYVDKSLHDALNGQTGDNTKITNATTRLTRYAVSHCKGLRVGG